MLGLAVVAGFTVASSVAVAAPPAGGFPLVSPTPAPDTSTPTMSASPQPTLTPSPGPAIRPADEDQWVNLAMYGGGGLIGAIIFFMIIGAILRHFRKQT